MTISASYISVVSSVGSFFSFLKNGLLNSMTCRIALYQFVKCDSYSRTASDSLVLVALTMTVFTSGLSVGIFLSMTSGSCNGFHKNAGPDSQLDAIFLTISALCLHGMPGCLLMEHVSTGALKMHLVSAVLCLRRICGTV